MAKKKRATKKPKKRATKRNAPLSITGTLDDVLKLLASSPKKKPKRKKAK